MEKSLFAIFILVVSSACHRSPELPENEFPLTVYSADFLAQNGTVGNPKELKSHFSNFPYQKPPNTLRLGFFGDSNTYGTEVEYGYDWPTLMERLLEKQWPHFRVEFLNFSKGGYGFQQNHVSFRKLASKYDLDYFIYGPKGLQIERDLSFSIFHGIVRGRYILRNNSPEFIPREVGGAFPQQAYARFTSLFPPLKYFRYDFKGPQAYRHVFDWLGGNPFYYLSMSAEDESRLINNVLLKEIKEQFPNRLLILSFLEKPMKVYSSWSQKVAMAHPIDKPTHFPYLMHSHGSSYAQELWARIYLAYLSGESEVVIPWIDCIGSPKGSPKVSPGIESSRGPFAEGIPQDSRIQLKTRTQLIGELKQNSVMWDAPRNSLFPQKTKAIVGFSEQQREFFDATYVALHCPVSSNTDVKILYSDGSYKVLGPPRQVFDGFPLYHIQSDLLTARVSIGNSVYKVAVDLDTEGSPQTPVSLHFGKDCSLGFDLHRQKKIHTLESSADSSYHFWGPKDVILDQTRFSESPLHLEFKTGDSITVYNSEKNKGFSCSTIERNLKLKPVNNLISLPLNGKK